MGTNGKQQRPWTLKTGGFWSLGGWRYHFQVVTVGQQAIGAFSLPTPTTFFGFVYTIPVVDTSSPTIVRGPGLPIDAFTTWFNTSTAIPLVDLDFLDTGGSHLSRFEIQVTTNAADGGIVPPAFTIVQSSDDFGGSLDAFTTDWALIPGTFDLLQPGTNFFTVRVFDQAGNFDVAISTFKVLKDTEPPVIPVAILLGAGGTGVAGGPLPVPAGATRDIVWCGDPQVAALLCPATATDTVSGLLSAPASLFLSTDSGTTFSLISSGEVNDGLFPGWITPVVNSTQAIIRIAYTDLAGNVQTQDGAVFTLGQPDLDLVTLLTGENFTPDLVNKFQENPNTYRLRVNVLNSGLVKVAAGEDVNFNSGTNLAAGCDTAAGDVCDFNQDKNITGPIDPGVRKPATMNAVDKPLPGTYVDAITITADLDVSLTEISETNNSVAVSLFVADAGANSVSVGACSYPELFSNISIRFSTISALKDGQPVPMFTSRNSFDLLELKRATQTAVAAIENLTGDFSGVRFDIESVVGVRSDTGESVVFSLPSPSLDVALSFTVPEDGLSNETILFDLANSIQETAPDTFAFIPTILQSSVESRSWEIAFNTNLVPVRLGESVDIPVTVSNTGTVDDIYALTFFSTGTGLTFELPSSVAVQAGSATTVNLRLTAPSDIGGQSFVDVPFQVTAVTTLLNSAGGFLGLPSPKAADAVLRVAFVAPPSFDPAPFLDNLLAACQEIQVSGTPDLVGDLQANGMVTVAGQAIVNGDVTAGSFKRTGQAQVTGTVTTAQNTLDCLPVDLAPLLIPIQDDGKAIIPPEFIEDGALVLDDRETLILASGTYLVSGLSITGGSTLLTDGTVNLFVQGPITVAGHSFTNQSETTNFVVFSDSSAPVEIAGNSIFRGIVYAPFADLTIAGTSDVRGHFFADNVAASGTTIDVANPPEVGTLVATGYVPGEGGIVKAVEIKGDEQKTKIEVIVPQGALKAAKRITISKEKHKDQGEAAKKEADLQAKNLKEISEGAEYGPEGTSFEKPVTLAFAYDTASLPEDVREDDLKIYYWNPVTQEWEEMLDSWVDKVTKKVIATTDHFSLYKVLGPPMQPAAGPDSAFVLGDVYVYPSPAVGGAAPTFHVETGIADRVTIRIYDISGQRVHETTLAGTPSTVDDGQGAQFAYEYAWQARIASGVYLYAVTSEKGGEKLVKSGKFAVIR